MYELSLQLDNGQLDGTTVYTLPNPLPNEDANGIINIDVPTNQDVGLIDPIGASRYNDPVPWWLFYVQIEADTGLAINLCEVWIRPSGFTQMFRVHTAAADSISRETGPTLSRGTLISLRADSGGGAEVYPAGDHRVILGLQPLLDGQECCSFQAGLNVFDVPGPA